MKNAYSLSMKTLGTNKKCVYFKKKAVFKCLGFTDGIKFPSRKEIMNFCISGSYEDCPFYIKKENCDAQELKK